MSTNYKLLTRSRSNRMIAGICAGMGEYSNIDPTVMRLIAVLLLFLTGPLAVIVYLILVLVIPEESLQQP